MFVCECRSRCVCALGSTSAVTEIAHVRHVGCVCVCACVCVTQVAVIRSAGVCAAMVQRGKCLCQLKVLNTNSPTTAAQTTGLGNSKGEGGGRRRKKQTQE